MKTLKQQAKDIIKERYGSVFPPSFIAQHFCAYYDKNSFEWLAKFLSENIQQNAKILDIGSGLGAAVLSLSNAGFCAVGVEKHMECAKLSKQRFEHQIKIDTKQKKFCLGEAHFLPFKTASFDCALMLNVVEHLESFSNCLQEVKRILKPNGIFFILCPNYGTFLIEPHYRIPWPPCLSKRNGVRYLKIFKKDPEFFKKSIFYCSYCSIHKELKKSGFQIYRPDLYKHLKNNWLLNQALKFVPFLRYISPTINILAKKT